jgi:inner membrane protein
LPTFAFFWRGSQVLRRFGLTDAAKTSYGGSVPSPIGHLLGGAIVGYAVAPSAVALCAIAGAAPDVDFLWGRHNQETHSIAAAVAAGLVVLAWKRDIRLAGAVTIAWLSHVLFDWLGSDTTPPLGVMALWPFSTEYYFSNAFFFEAISRRYWLDNFISHNAWAVAREMLILGPPLAIVMSIRSRARRRSRRQDRA